MTAIPCLPRWKRSVCFSLSLSLSLIALTQCVVIIHFMLQESDLSFASPEHKFAAVSWEYKVCLVLLLREDRELYLAIANLFSFRNISGDLHCKAIPCSFTRNYSKWGYGTGSLLLTCDFGGTWCQIHSLRSNSQKMRAVSWSFTSILDSNLSLPTSCSGTWLMQSRCAKVRRDYVAFSLLWYATPRPLEKISSLVDLQKQYLEQQQGTPKSVIIMLFSG